jgi:hypothetical protein
VIGRLRQYRWRQLTRHVHLADDGVRADLERAGTKILVKQTADDDDSDVGVEPTNVPTGVEAVHPRHRDVRHHDIGQRLANLSEQILPVDSDRHHIAMRP